jgi:transcriptional regulator GlxA family with amidase domain
MPKQKPNLIEVDTGNLAAEHVARIQAAESRVATAENAHNARKEETKEAKAELDTAIKALRTEIKDDNPHLPFVRVSADQ